jgi:hypothetical protein
MIKKEGKRQTLMYNKVKNYSSNNKPPEKISLKKLTGNGISSGLYEEPVISTVVNASVLTLNNEKSTTKFNKVTVLNTPTDPKIKKSNILTADILKQNKIHGLYKSVIDNENKHSLCFTKNFADLLRLSNNSGVRQL